jgi:hypothetical protein
MNTPDATNSALRFRIEAEVSAGMKVLFYRHPELCGFVVRDRAGLPAHVNRDKLEGEIFITEIGLYPRLDKTQYDEIYEEIAKIITRLVNDKPETKDVLVGRTFARTMH